MCIRDSCREYCPADAILQDKENVRILDEKCIGCGECLVICPEGAVKMRWDNDDRRIQEKMAEYALAARNLFGKKIAFVNFLTRMTKNCDCMDKDGPRITDDIGILAGADAVAVDRASVDLILKNRDRDILREANDIDWRIQLDHGEKIGLGNQRYDLIEL